jgi:hypothetical protein
MSILKKQNPALLLFSLLFLSSCLTPKKMDKFVAEQYGNQFPKQVRKMKADISVASAVTYNSNTISTTIRKTSNFLPLIVYWQCDYRHTCTLNPQIALTNFTNTVNTLTNKGLGEKLKGQRLELTVQQMPTAFSLVDKARMVWVIYAFSWNKIYMEPDFKDLVVSYKLLENDVAVKTGTISVKGDARNKGLRFFQSWKSATSEYVADYNANITAMSKAFMNQLVEEL